MGLISCLSKTLLVILNVIVFAFGAVLIALASFLIHKKNEFQELLLNGQFTLPILVLLVGILITIIGFFGCCGAAKENSCMLYTYASIVSVLLIAELTLGILIALYPKKVAEKVKEKMVEKFKEYNTNNPELTKNIDTFQSSYFCCGVDDPEDWFQTTFRQIPRSCCKDPTNCSNPPSIVQSFDEGCYKVIADNLKGATIALGIIAIVLSVIQVVCVCAACGLAHKRRNYVT